MAEIQGRYDGRFAAVAEALAASIDRGTDVGGLVAVVHDGEVVADIWGGWVDEARRRRGSRTRSRTCGRRPRR
jgi:CubicO group peptidase (beta-lactamase class C family)